MKHTNKSRLLSLLLVVAMVISMLPVGVFAQGSASYTRITSADELTSGKYVMVVSSGYAPTVLSGTWVLAEAVSVTEDTVTDPAANLVWDITVDGETVKLTDSAGVTVAPKGGNNNGIKSGDYSWSVTCTDGTFQFFGQDADTVVLASNPGSDNKFRGYKTATVSGNPDSYPSFFSLYKLSETEAEPTEPEVTDPAPVEPEGQRYELVTSVADGEQVVLYNAGSGTL